MKSSNNESITNAVFWSNLASQLSLSKKKTLSNTVLKFASLNSNEEILTKLFENEEWKELVGGDYSRIQDYYDEHGLFKYFIKNGNLKLFKSLLLKYNQSDINKSPTLIPNLFEYVLKEYNAEYVEYFLSLENNNININLFDSAGHTPLHRAVKLIDEKTTNYEIKRENQLKIVEVLLAQKDINVNSFDTKRACYASHLKVYTPLIAALKDNKHDKNYFVIKALLSHNDIDLSKNGDLLMIAYGDHSTGIRLSLFTRVKARPLKSVDAELEAMRTHEEIGIKDSVYFKQKINSGSYRTIKLLLKHPGINLECYDRLASKSFYGIAREFADQSLLDILDQTDIVKYDYHFLLDVFKTPSQIIEDIEITIKQDEAIEKAKIFLSLPETNANLPLWEGNTLLHMLLIYRLRDPMEVYPPFTEFLKHLLSCQKVDLNLRQKNNKNQTPLEIAVGSHQASSDFFILLNNHRVDVNDANRGGNTLLHSFMISGYNIAEIITRNTEWSKGFRDKEGQKKTIEYRYKLLLEHEKIDVNAQNCDGNTPLHYFNSDFIKGYLLLLNNNDTNVTIKNGDGNTPLHTLCQELCDIVYYGYKKVSVPSMKIIINKFLSKCPDLVNFQNYDGDSLLHILGKKAFESLSNWKIIKEIMNIFLSKNPNLINIQNNDGDTVLHLLCMNHKDSSNISIFKEILNDLLENPAVNLNKKNKENLTVEMMVKDVQLSEYKEIKIKKEVLVALKKAKEKYNEKPNIVIEEEPIDVVEEIAIVAEETAEIIELAGVSTN